MLSGTSTQSPVSSILTMPTVSMSGGTMPTMGAPSLMSDSIFLSSVPSMTNDGAADKHDVAGEFVGSRLTFRLTSRFLYGFHYLQDYLSFSLFFFFFVDNL